MPLAEPQEDKPFLVSFVGVVRERGEAEQGPEAQYYGTAATWKLRCPALRYLGVHMGSHWQGPG